MRQRTAQEKRKIVSTSREVFGTFKQPRII